MEKRNSQLESGQLIEQTRGVFCTCHSGVARCQTQHQYNSLLANKFDVRRVLHGKVSLAAVNQICAIREAMDGSKKPTGLLRKCIYCLTTGMRNSLF